MKNPPLRFCSSIVPNPSATGKLSVEDRRMFKSLKHDENAARTGQVKLNGLVSEEIDQFKMFYGFLCARGNVSKWDETWAFIGERLPSLENANEYLKDMIACLKLSDQI